MSDENKKHEGEKKHHEKRIVGRVNHNNINLSHHAKHDWKPAHHEHHKAAAKAREAASSDPINVRVYFQEVDRVGEGEGELEPIVMSGSVVPPVPATPISLPDGVQYLSVTLPGDASAKDLLAALHEEYGDDFACLPDPNVTIIPPAQYYVETMTIKNSSGIDVSYITTNKNEGYDPDPDQLYDGVFTIWHGTAWMFYNGHFVDNSGNPMTPCWDPDDNAAWSESNPDGDDGYPNGTLDMYHPLSDLLPYVTENNVKYYEITFSHETQCFGFYYEERIVNGETHMVLVIRPLRRKK